MPEKNRISVRALVEFALEGGDLAREMGALDRMLEGAQGHRMVQSAYGDRFRSEVSISLTTEIHGIRLTLYGRIDGLCEGSEPPVVEEIKTTRMNPQAICADDYPVHWAQAEMYAYMLARRRGYARVAVRLLYTNLMGESVRFERVYDADALDACFLKYAEPYAAWLSHLANLHARTMPTIKALDFPYDSYRDGQREMAVSAYNAIKDRKNLIVSAPTGIGKTAAALFPAIKALGEGLVTHIFYLTARGTQRRAAEDALEKMRARGLKIRSVVITAKEKACAFPGMPCDPMGCPRAAGYYDRRRDALVEALSSERLDTVEIARIAETWSLCPFEFSLDLSEQADVIICDYNYAFDPRVRLRRFFLDKGDYALLIDEAHHLPERAREMYSASIDQRDFMTLRKLLKRNEHAQDAANALTEVISVMKKLALSYEEPISLEEPPEPLYQPVADFLEAARPLLSEGIDGHKQLFDAYFAALDYLRVADAFSGDYRALIEIDDKKTKVRLWCHNPAHALRDSMSRVRGCLLFSATLSPIEYYMRASGLSEEEGDSYLELESPFPAENLLAARLAVDTRYAKRAQTAPMVARALRDMCESKTGNYLACFPSYAYMKLVLEYFLALSPKADAMMQRGDMTDRQRQEFIGRFQESPNRSLVAFIAMGGVFAEGIDLPGERLIGAAIIGVGLPQPSFEREVMRALADDGEGEGFLSAYVYPGIERVLQAAGRVIRTETDRGIVLLIDQRYEAPQYQELLPRYWKLRALESLDLLKPTLRTFWEESAFP